MIKKLAKKLSATDNSQRVKELLITQRLLTRRLIAMARLSINRDAHREYFCCINLKEKGCLR